MHLFFIKSFCENNKFMANIANIYVYKSTIIFWINKHLMQLNNRLTSKYNKSYRVSLIRLIQFLIIRGPWNILDIENADIINLANYLTLFCSACYNK